MENYKKLDKIIEDLDKESKSLRNLSSIINRLNDLHKTTSENFQKIRALKDEFKSISNIQLDNADKLEATLENIDSSINKSIEQLEQNQNSLKGLLNDGINDLNSNVEGMTNSLVKKIENGYVHINKNQTTALENFNDKIDEIYKDNKAFQKELDTSIASRLDKHKSDIQVEIRNEGTQIQRAFETALNSNFNQMESKIKDSFERQTKQLNILKILTFILIALSIGLAVGLFVIK